MKKLVFLSIILHQSFSFAQDTTHVNHTNKITKLIDKVHVINEVNIKNKEQILNKSKIDGLLLKIETINNEQQKSTILNDDKLDSLRTVIQQLSSSNIQKDSLIASLKKQLEYTKTANQFPTNSLNVDQKNNTNKYIVLGAYHFKSNAEKQVNKLRNYDVELTSSNLNSLHYVVYKLKSKEKIVPTLSKFRNKIEPNAWYIAF